jgi:hypothetical protein
MLISLVTATDSSAEISIDGTLTRNFPIEEEPKYYPISTCYRVEDEEILRNSSLLLSQQVKNRIGRSLSEYSDFPDLVSIDDCGDFFVVSSVLGDSTVGQIWRMIFPKSESDSLKIGTIDQRKVLLFLSTSE